jgi:hypothetical protein
MRMVRRLALYVGLAPDAARWVGLRTLVVCFAIIVSFIEFQRP